MESAVQEWEMDEVKPCPCLDVLDQSKAVHVPEKPKCSQCDLTNNLWLCLATGHLGCGRKNYDGSGGNGHAKEYAEATGNNLCLKLGTITPEGKASINCYKCDADVYDPNLAEHLKAFGIDMKMQTKTEKSIAETNLEANLSL